MRVSAGRITAAEFHTAWHKLSATAFLPIYVHHDFYPRAPDRDANARRQWRRRFPARRRNSRGSVAGSAAR